VDMCSPPGLTTAPSHWHWPHKAHEPPKLLRPRGEPKCLTSNIDRTGLLDTVKHPANMVLEHEFCHLSNVRHQALREMGVARSGRRESRVVERLSQRAGGRARREGKEGAKARKRKAESKAGRKRGRRAESEIDD
jgi:hypothetical protein